MRHRPHGYGRIRRRGSVVVIVMWTLALAAITASAAQMLAYRQATIGRQSLERIQARWSARAGIENTIAVMAYHTENPVPDDAFAMVFDMEAVAHGELLGSRYRIRQTIDGLEWEGPKDEHSKLNVNINNPGLLLALFEDQNMTMDVADAIRDWIDDDDESGTLGVESDYYLSLNPPYEPRNGLLRTVAELELVAGIWPEHLRGEDWNLNGQLDPNENDGGRTLPYDDRDAMLDAGWSEFLTTYSVAGGATASGLPRIYLRRAEPEELVAQAGVDDAQARSLIYFGRNQSNTVEQLLTVPLNQIDNRGNATGGVYNADAAPLTEDQIRQVLDEVTVTDPVDRLPGRMNINTVSPRLLRDLLEALGQDEYLADEIIFLREGRPEGITSILDLREIPDLNPQTWETLASLFTTRGNVYTINSRGQSRASGLEVEIIVVVDRSTVPVKILEYREQ